MNTNESTDKTSASSEEISSIVLNYDDGRAEKENANSEDQDKDPGVDQQTEKAFVTGRKLAMIVISLQVTNLCIAIDNTIIATATPTITNQFKSLGDVGWYGSAYLLFVSGFQLFFGRLYSFLNTKWLFIASLSLFEIGSLTAATAPNSSALIAGRAISGLGASGVFTGALTTISTVVPLVQRGLFIGLVTAVYGAGSILGPLLGGAFTDHVSWRWCFYINLPLGGFTIFILVLFLHLPKSPRSETKTWREKILRFDPIGTILFVPSIICLLLALQWGGTTYQWNNGRIIGLLVVFGALLLGFAAVQPLMGVNATLNAKTMTTRHVACATLYSFCVSASFFVMAYFIPIWFQAIRGASAVRSGIDLLPLMISLIGSIMTAGWACSKIGHYTPFMFAPITLGAVGAGLIYTWDIDTATSKVIGYQVLYGTGVGLGIQQAVVAVQACSKDVDIPSGIALLCFAENLGGAVFISVAQNLWANRLASKVQNIAGVDPAQVVKTGATEIAALSQDRDTLQAIKIAYNDALSRPFLVALVLLCIASIGSLGVDWKSIKPQGGESKGIDEQKKQDAAKADDAQAHDEVNMVEIGKK